METALNTCFAVLLWFLSSTVLLPFILLLRLNKTFSNMWFSFLYSYIILPILKPKLLPNRKRAFKLLEEELSRRNKSVPLKVLEIGIGDGANLPLYPENSKLTAVDMNPSFESSFRTNKKKYPQVELERIVHCMAENMPQVSDASMDVVICTYVMCSVIDGDSVLREVKRVLKPGGKFLFLEHVIYESYGWKYLLQQVITPLWKIYCNGCTPNRNTRNTIDKAGFTSVSCERFLSPSLWLYIRPHIIGIATN